MSRREALAEEEGIRSVQSSGALPPPVLSGHLCDGVMSPHRRGEDDRCRLCGLQLPQRCRACNGSGERVRSGGRYGVCLSCAGSGEQSRFEVTPEGKAIRIPENDEDRAKRLRGELVELVGDLTDEDVSVAFDEEQGLWAVWIEGDIVEAGATELEALEASLRQAREWARDLESLHAEAP